MTEAPTKPKRQPMPRLGECSNCLHWEIYPADVRRAYGALSYGSCRRYPPAALMSAETEADLYTNGLRPRWPKMRSDERCGEYRHVTGNQRFV